MKAQKLTGIRQMRMHQVPMPKIVNPTDVLLKIACVGVCGSDVHYYETGRIGNQVVQYPFTVGHECSGTVVDFGPAVQGLEKGEPVVVEPAISCGQCDQCCSGRQHTCQSLKFLGCPGQIEGCLSEYLVMPAECCFPTRGKITPQQGVLCEPFAIGLYAAKLSGLCPGQTAAVFGAGPIGLSCLEGVRQQGALRIYVTEKIAERCAIAAGAGATWVGNPDNEDVVKPILAKVPSGIDMAFECAGQQETLDQAVKILKPGGKLMLIGIPRQDCISFSPDLVRRKEIAIFNVRRQNHCTQTAVDLIARGKVNLDYMITHTFGFDRTQEAFELVAGYRDGVVKAMIRMD
jgi:L-iditol 2-dehydrogenase